MGISYRARPADPLQQQRHRRLLATAILAPANCLTHTLNS